MKPYLLIVDDDDEIRTQMKWALSEEYEILLADDRSSALAQFREKQPAVVLLDLGLPPSPTTPQEGFLALPEMLAQRSSVKIVVVSGQSEKKNALQAIDSGAYDFITKPVDLEEVRIILKRAFHVAHLEQECRDLQLRVSEDSFEGMLGISS